MQNKDCIHVQCMQALYYNMERDKCLIMQIVQGNNHGHHVSHKGCDNLYFS